jgi:type II secretory ATPase GspE/PulE/Tfp pilus assembly ATPase PilB-like protein
VGLCFAGIFAFYCYRDWKSASFCKICQAAVRWPALSADFAYCPSCLTLVDPDKIMQGTVGVLDISTLDQIARAEPISKLVALVLVLAMKEKIATELHLEPGEETLRLAYKVDGLLNDLIPPARFSRPIAQTILAIAGFNFDQCVDPQKGRILVRLQGQAVEMSVATEPTEFGQKVVLHLAGGAATRGS